MAKYNTSKKEENLSSDTLKDSIQTLNKIEKRLIDTVRIAQLGHWELNFKTNELWWSDEKFRIFNLKPGEIKPDYKSFLHYVHPEDRKLFQNSVRKAIQTGKLEVTHRIILKNKVQKTVYEAGEVTFDSEKKPLYISGTIRDVTKEKKLIDFIETERQRFEELNKLKTDFLMNLGHDIRNPLNCILGFTELLLNSPENNLNEEQIEYLGFISEAGNLLFDLSKQVFDLAKIESGKLVFCTEIFALKEILIECIHITRPNAQKFQIQIENQIKDIDNISLNTDKTRFRQIILNLMSNAIKYNKNEGKIILRTSLIENNMIRIEIEDTGYGIPYENHKNIFHPFFRINSQNSKIAVTGIGLSISKELIEMMKGKIGFHSKPDTGSIFFIEIPAFTKITSVTEKKEEEEEKNTRIFMKSDNNRYPILCIEGSKHNIFLIERIINFLDNAVLISTLTAVKSIEISKGIKPKLILLDIELPDIEDCNLIKHLKENQNTSRIPVIGMFSNPSTEEKLLNKDDYYAFLRKPFKVSKALEVITNALNHLPSSF